MYEKFYQLQADPFRLSPDHSFCYRYPSFARGRAYMRYALQVAEGFVVVTGRPGMGKTTLINDLLAEFGPKDYLTASVVTTTLAANDLLRTIAYEFDLPVQGMDKATVIHELKKLFVFAHRTRRPPLLIVDEAQNLNLSTLEELRLLTNLQQNGRPLLQIFLLGQEQLRQKLKDPKLEQLRQRITAAARLEPLTLEEVRAYVIHRLRVVGWDNFPRLEAAILPILLTTTEGVPRRINQFCSRLLLFGAAEEKGELGAEDARLVAAELRSEGLTHPSETPVAVDESSLPDEYYLAEALFTAVQADASDQDAEAASPSTTEADHEPVLDLRPEWEIDAAVTPDSELAPVLQLEPEATSQPEPESQPSQAADPVLLRADDVNAVPKTAVSPAARVAASPQPMPPQPMPPQRAHVASPAAARSRDSVDQPRHSPRWVFGLLLLVVAVGGLYYAETRYQVRAWLQQTDWDAMRDRASAFLDQGRQFQVEEQPTGVPSTEAEPDDTGMRPAGLSAGVTPDPQRKLDAGTGQLTSTPAVAATGVAQDPAVSSPDDRAGTALDSMPPPATQPAVSGVEDQDTATRLVNGASSVPPEAESLSAGETLSPKVDALPEAPSEATGSPPTPDTAATVDQPVAEVVAEQTSATRPESQAMSESAEPDQQDAKDPVEAAQQGAPTQRPSLVTEIGFAFDSHEVDAAAAARLKVLADDLEEHQALDAELVGYTDEAGDPRYNRELSLLRAESVRHFLVQQGVPRNRLRVVKHNDAAFDTLRQLDPPKSKRAVQVIVNAQP